MPAAGVRHDASQSLTGALVNVQDGDSFRLRLVDGRIVRVRIGAIDAPELGQPGGRAARDALIGLLAHAPIRIDVYKTDPFGRYVARVTVGDVDVGLAMVRAGQSWHFSRYAREQPAAQRLRYATAQRDAQRQRLGLWADPDAQPPWDYRRTPRGGRVQPAG